MPLLNIIGNVNQIKNPNIAYTVPFSAVGGIKETFVTGGVSYTMHSFVSGSGSFEILSGNTNAEVLIVGGGGTGLQGSSDAQRSTGGGGGDAFVTSIAFQESQIYGTTSSYNAYVGGGGIQTVGTASNFIKTYDFNYIPYNPTQYLADYGFAGAILAGGESGNGNAGGNGGRAGGGGAGGTGSSATGFTGGNGGTGIAAPYYFGGPSGSYPILVGGGGGGGAEGINLAGSGSYGGGNGGGFQQLGASGSANTGGGGGGGYNETGGPDYFGGNGGSGVIRIVYVTQP